MNIESAEEHIGDMTDELASMFNMLANWDKPSAHAVFSDAYARLAVSFGQLQMIINQSPEIISHKTT